MAVCRFCGSVLEALLVEEVIEERYWLEPNGYEYEDSRSEVLKREYKCPNCYKTIATNEDDAKLLLKQ
jgi:hypothetical protein